MKNVKLIIILLAIIFLASCSSSIEELPESPNFAEDTPSLIPMLSHELLNTTDAAQETSDLQPGERVFDVDMSVEEISQFLRGRVFQRGGSSVAAGMGELIFFTPEGNEFFWFCSTMDAQSRIRAEYGTWELEDGFMTSTTLRLVERIDGHFVRSSGSIATRFTLVDFNEVVTEVNIASSDNFRMFRFLQCILCDPVEMYGFFYRGTYFFPYPMNAEGIRADHERFFSLLEYKN